MVVDAGRWISAAPRLKSYCQDLEMFLNISGEHARTGVAADAGAAAAGYGHDVPQHQGQRLHHLSAHRAAGDAAVGALVRQQRRPKHRHVPPPAGRHRPPVRSRCFLFSLRLPFCFPRLFPSCIPQSVMVTLRRQGAMLAGRTHFWTHREQRTPCQHAAFQSC